MADDAVYRAAFIRMHPTGKVVLSLSEASQGTEAELAGIVAEELGIPPEDVKVVHEDDDRFGEGNSFNSAPERRGRGERRRDRPQAARQGPDRGRRDARASSPDSLNYDNGHWTAEGADPEGVRIQAVAAARLRRLRDAGRARRLARRPDDVQARGRAAAG